MLTTTRLIDNFLEGKNGSIIDLVERARIEDLTDEETIRLALGLANSGTRLTFSKNEVYCDIASTGGPGSLSTLLCPLILNYLGGNVVKLGVPGRPAGGIDTLMLLKNFNFNPSVLQITDWIGKTGYVHFLGNEKYTPLDTVLFNYRKANQAVNIPSLVISSLLSKKISVGLNTVGLDIRVSKNGNFGKNFNEARSNAKRFNALASKLNISSTCFLTDGEIAQQPYIGRGESLFALSEIFSQTNSKELATHLKMCMEMAFSLLNRPYETISSSALLDIFIANITCQGGKEDDFWTYCENVKANHFYQIAADSSGILLIDLYRIRDLIVKVQEESRQLADYDPCGVILKKSSNTPIEKNEVICSFRCHPKFVQIFQMEIDKCFDIKPFNAFSFEVIV